MPQKYISDTYNISEKWCKILKKQYVKILTPNANLKLLSCVLFTICLGYLSVRIIILNIIKYYLLFYQMFPKWCIFFFFFFDMTTVQLLFFQSNKTA